MSPEPATVIYDASCVLCSRSANFIARWDRRGVLSYAALHSAPAVRLLRGHGLEPGDVDSVMLFEPGGVSSGSTAALRILGRLPLPWSLARLLLIIPNSVREPPYRFVARNRRRLLSGRSCPAPHPRLRERLLT